jgi:REP element-mobilizing transposase RayT
MGKSRYKIVADGNTYFITSAIANWIPLFAVTELAQILLDALRFSHTQNRITLHAFVVMENHFHLIGSSSNFSGDIRKLKSFTARSIIDHLEANGPKFFLEQLAVFKKHHKISQKYQVWQEGYHPKVILDEKTLLQKLDYIHFNPVKRGYVDKPEHWRYSSFRHYIGGESLAPVEPLL